MNEASRKAIIREMDAEELEQEAVIICQRCSNTWQDHNALLAVQKNYKQLTGYDLVINTMPQFVS